MVGATGAGIDPDLRFKTKRLDDFPRAEKPLSEKVTYQDLAIIDMSHASSKLYCACNASPPICFGKVALFETVFNLQPD